MPRSRHRTISALQSLQPESTADEYSQTVAEADLEEAWMLPAQIFQYK